MDYVVGREEEAEGLIDCLFKRTNSLNALSSSVLSIHRRPTGSKSV